MNELTHLDLFSGIGGFALAAQWAGFRTIGFCEIDKYCQRVLAKNFRAVLCHSNEHSKSTLPLHAKAPELSAVVANERGVAQSDQRAMEIRNGESVIFSNIFDLDGRQFAGVDLM